MNIVLVHPPLDDPTLPYHSSAYLTGHLLKNGFSDVIARDINIEFVNYCLLEESVKLFQDEAERRRAKFEHRSKLSFIEQDQFLDGLAASRIEPARIQRAARELRTRETFLDYPTYLSNVDVLNRYFGFLGSLSYPIGVRNFRLTTRGRFSYYNFDDLFAETLSDEISFAFARYFHSRLLTDVQFLNADCIGISVIYDHQLPFSLWMGNRIKKLWPEKLVLLGGTSVSQHYKHLRDRDRIYRFSQSCDAMIVGEGETALCEIAAAGGDLAGSPKIANTIWFNRETGKARFPERIHYENVPDLGAPVYSHPWDLYLAPERGINYSPTRGCYWNRCTFCDYGLNGDKPTSPWRERRIDQVISDLQSVVNKEKVKYVYLAVDVMAPGYLERLSDAIVDSGLDIRWSGEIRMEKIFLPERCRKMVKAGCVSVSFGMESGNQRILNLIDKGTKVQYMAETMRNFSDAGMAVQLMAFKGFPTETDDERRATLDFVNQNREYWSTGEIGTFLLTGTAMIAKNPAKFDVVVIEKQGVDVNRMLNYREKETERENDRMTEDYSSWFDNDGGVFPVVLGRPWAGGIDTLHSMIYYEVHGKHFFKDHSLEKIAASTEDIENWQVERTGEAVRSAYDLRRIILNRRRYDQRMDKLKELSIEPTYQELSRQAESSSLAPGFSPETCWLIGEETCVRVDEPAFRVLEQLRESVSVETLLSGLPHEQRESILQTLQRLGSAGLLTFTCDGRVVKRESFHHAARAAAGG